MYEISRRWRSDALSAFANASNIAVSIDKALNTRPLFSPSFERWFKTWSTLQTAEYLGVGGRLLNIP